MTRTGTHYYPDRKICREGALLQGNKQGPAKYPDPNRNCRYCSLLSLEEVFCTFAQQLERIGSFLEKCLKLVRKLNQNCVRLHVNICWLISPVFDKEGFLNLGRTGWTPLHYCLHQGIASLCSCGFGRGSLRSGSVGFFEITEHLQNKLLLKLWLGSILSIVARISLKVFVASFVTIGTYVFGPEGPFTLR